MNPAHKEVLHPPRPHVVGLQFGALLAGAIVNQNHFQLAGPGRLVVTAISNRDYALVQGLFALDWGSPNVLVNLLTDLVYRFVTPRMR